MSNLLQFVGGERRIKQIVGSGSPSGILIGHYGCDSKSVYPTSTSGQLQTVLSISGAGALNIAAVSGSYLLPTPSTRLRITLDGLVVRDNAMHIGEGGSFIGIGFPATQYDNTNFRYEVNGITPQRCRFMSSCLVEVSTSATGGTNPACAVLFAYEVHE